MTRHAYLILAHKNPSQIAKLLGALDAPDNDIFLHLDKRSSMKYKQFESCCRNAGLFFIRPRIRVNWGGVSIMRAELALLKAAVSKGQYSYYHLVSGMDLPLKSNAEIHEFFERNAGKEFFTMLKTSEFTDESIHYRHIFPESNHFYLAKKLRQFHIDWQKKRDCPINSGVEGKYASQWFSITDGFARYIVDNMRWLMHTFRNTGLTDEMFAATLLSRSPFAGNLYDTTLYRECEGVHAGGNMRLTDWGDDPDARHPRTFTSADYDMLCRASQLWARKFDETVDSEIIDRILAETKKG